MFSPVSRGGQARDKQRRRRAKRVGTEANAQVINPMPMHESASEIQSALRLIEHSMNNLVVCA